MKAIFTSTLHMPSLALESFKRCKGTLINAKALKTGKKIPKDPLQKECNPIYNEMDKNVFLGKIE